MANSFAISRSYLMYGVCLPLAVLIGYFLAEPLESGSKAVVILVLAVLSIPLFMRWHYTLLIGSWNAVCLLYFLPGTPTLWMVMTFISLFFSLLNRSLGHNQPFFAVRSVAWSLVVLAGVVVSTALLTGGLGLRSLGSETFGGKKYFFLLGGILGYFALAGQRISRNRAGSYVALFLLSGLVVGVGYLAALSGVDFVSRIFPVEEVFMADAGGTDVLSAPAGIFRLGSIIPVAIGVFCYLLARYGIRNLCDLKRPWRLFLLGLALVAGLACGFRSELILLVLTFICVFYWEGLFQARYVMLLLAGVLLVGGLVLPFAYKLPLGMQRTLSFLPVNLDPIVRSDAEGSTNWRFEIWKQLLPDIPRYLIKGKGYAIDPGDLYMSIVSGFTHNATGENSSIVSGDYHNGPLSVIIPFGIFGVIAFLWFLGASLRVLYLYYRFGDPALKTCNTFLLAFFIVRVFSFFFLFGSLYSEMYLFTGLIGFGVSLNGEVRSSAQAEESLELAEESD